jgi:3-oxoadipate enol-lactonase
LLRAIPVTLPGRGRTTIWEAAGPPGAPALVLLHGVTLTAALNWSGVAPLLARDYRVLMFDQRGHGAGLPSPTFRLEDSADDVAAIAAELGITPSS